MVTILFAVISISSYSQVDKKNLEGTWKLTNTESEFELEVDFDGNPTRKIIPDIILQFEQNWDLTVSQSGIRSKINYRLKDSTLFFGNRKYKILSLTG